MKNKDKCQSIDGYDAYPFQGNKRQEFAQYSCLKQNGVLVHISATITAKQRDTYDAIVSLSERFHRYPLPLITFERMYTYQFLRWHHVDSGIKEWINRFLKEKAPIFIFVPTIELGKKWGQVLQQCFPQERVEVISSEIDDRSPFLERIRVGALKIIVTTTILERGVTFDNIQVIILEADHHVFDAQTLIQIAGRVGRTPQHPTGAIIFMYQSGITQAMYLAKKYHLAANKGEVLFLK